MSNLVMMLGAPADVSRMDGAQVSHAFEESIHDERPLGCAVSDFTVKPPESVHLIVPSKVSHEKTKCCLWLF